jgi:hypothetical protein
MNVRDLIKKLQEIPESEQDKTVFVDNPMNAVYGTDLTGYMGYGIEEVESVRKIQEGYYISLIPSD